MAAVRQKLETRNPKLETNPNDSNDKSQPATHSVQPRRRGQRRERLSFGICRLRFVSGFVLRISCLLCLLAGCTPPAATLELIAVARAGLADAKAAGRESHEALMRQFVQQQAALDAAFDADVHLAEAGTLRDAQGNPVAMDGRWVIAARKGYVAARDAVARQAVAAQAVHATRQDNLAAADEALQMARDLIVEQQGLNLRTRQYLMSLQKSNE